MARTRKRIAKSDRVFLRVPFLPPSRSPPKTNEVDQPCSSSGGSLASSAALLHASAISRLICITTASMLGLTTMSRLQRAAMPDRCVSVMPAIWSISLIDRVTSHQGALLLLDPDAQQCRLRQGMLRISRSARRLLPLASQISEVGNTALIEREAVTLSLDHTFGFEFADVGPGAIEVQRQCRCADSRGLSGSRSRDRLGVGRAINGRSQPSCSFLLRRDRIAHFPVSAA